MMRQVQFREKVAYGLGDAASSMFWKLFGMYLLFFYTDIFGLDAAVVGTMFLITRVWDSLFDPVVGAMADRTESRWGKFRPYLLWMALPFGVLGALTFTTPGFSDTGNLIYAYVTYSLMMMVYSLINVPYASLLGVMSANPNERTALSAYRMVFAFLGGILVLVLIEPLVDFFGNMGDGEMDLQLGWSLAAAVLACLAMAFFLGTFLGTRERVKPIKETANSLREDVGDLLRNRPWWILLGAGVAALIFNSIRDGAAVYYFKYYAVVPAGFDLGFIGPVFSVTTAYLVIGQAANILGIVLIAPVSSRIGKKRAYLWAMLLATVFSVLFYFIGPESIWAMLAMQVLISACAGSIFPLLWSMYADIADYAEWKNQRRATGLIFSSSSMSQKFGWSIGGAMTGWLLAYFGFEANVVQTAEAQGGIRLMLSLLPAAGALISVLFIARYPLDEEKVKRVSAELEAQRRA